jgi:DNA-binding FadR family transcriptional regulator
MAVLLAEAITEDLVRNGVEAGTTLPPEAVMMRQYDVGRATVREALRLLEARGLIEVRPGRSGGPVVRNLDPSEFAQALALLLRVSESSVREVVEAREVIEPALAAQAALNRTDEDIDEIRVVQKLVAASVDDEEAFSLHNRAFHGRIAAASGNQPMHVFWQAISLIADGHVAGVRYRRSDRVAGAMVHERIIDAIIGRDADAAARLMGQHVGAMHSYMRHHYPAVLRRGVTLLSHRDL